MQIKDIIIEDAETLTLADVQIMYGDDPKMMQAIQTAKLLPKITSWDQAVDKASATMQQQQRRDARNSRPKADREFATAKMNTAKANKKADPDAQKKTRGAQVGNQNAFKGGPGIIKGIKQAYNSIKDFGKDGYINAVSDTMDSGKAMSKSVSDRYTKMARKRSQSPKDTFNN
tara:strand:+ start:819 stop:1337 length:519 start_codon:yes stop_codon:yes gene_type:complete